MKKVVFALIGALAMASIPLNVNAADECVIQINSGETKTINYNTGGCRVENRGTLNVVNGANISKYTQNAYAAIDNYGVLNISGGSIYADYGYTIMNHAGSVNVSGGSIHSILHQAIWGKAGTNIRVTGGTLKGAIGGEEVIYTNGNISICGGSFNGPRSNRGESIESASCPKPVEPAVSQQTAPKNEEVITISVTTSEKKTQTANKTTAASPKSTATQVIAAKSDEKPSETKTETPKQEEKIEAKKDEKAEQETAAETETEAKAEDNNFFVFVLAAIIAVFGTATAAIVVNRIHRQ